MPNTETPAAPRNTEEQLVGLDDCIECLRDIAKINRDVPDCRDAQGREYQSAWLDGILKRIEANMKAEAPK